MLAFKKSSTHLHSNQPKLSPVSESSTHPLQNYVCFFPRHLQTRECPQTYSLSLALEWSQVTHTPASIKSGGAYKPEKSAFYSTFAWKLCDDTRLPGWLSASPVHSQTFKPTQTSFAHTNSQPLHSTGYKIFSVFFFLFLFFKFWRISSKFRPATWKCCQTTTKGRRPHQRDTPLVDSDFAAMGQCKQANKFQSHHYSHLTSLIIHEQIGPICDSR